MSRLSNLGKQFAVCAIDDFVMSKSVCETVHRKAFRDMAPILCLSSAHAGEIKTEKSVRR